MSTLASQDTERAHRERCDNGELLSCNLLGLMYETGAGVTRDLARAVALYQRACDGGVMVGCTRLQLTRRNGPDAPSVDGFLRIGRIADAETGEPVSDASVELPGIGLRAISDESGRVELGRLQRVGIASSPSGRAIGRSRGSYRFPGTPSFYSSSIDRPDRNRWGSDGSSAGLPTREESMGFRKWKSR